MSNVILFYGPIGSGKTQTCIYIAAKLCSMRKNIGGILSKRVYKDGELIGYDCIDLSSGNSFPIARLHHQVIGPDWFNFRELKYAFSKIGFEKANCILIRNANEVNTPTLIFIDEYGRLESAGMGIYPGVIKLIESMKNGINLIILCRTDLVGAIEDLLKGRAKKVYKYEPRDFEELWNQIQVFL